MILCKEIEFGSKEHRDSIRLRSTVLREPLGLQFSNEELDAEYNQIHLGAFTESGLSGILLLKPLGGSEVKMRQVAVRPDQSRQGIGKMLVKFSEQVAQQKGFNLMTLHARETAVPFYLKMGYQTIGNVFAEVGIPHFKMEKVLS
jgi:GNAT superfamily N-acetyltransferase